MKPCLKHSHWAPTTGQYPPPPSSPRCTGGARKCVAFQTESLEQVYLADEWDRSPMEPARKLSYQDMLELKEIQNSLPRANQPADPLAGRSGKHYLSGVPIGLLPLLPASDSTASPSPSTASPASSAGSNPYSNSSRVQPKSIGSQPHMQSSPATWLACPGRIDSVFHSSHNNEWQEQESEKERQREIERQRQEELQRYHRPSYAVPPPPIPTSTKQKPRFPFLPLLDTPSAPSPAPSNPAPSIPYSHPQPPPSFSMPSRPMPSSFVESKLSASMRQMSIQSKPAPTEAPASKPRKKKRNVIFINDMEIEVDSDSEEEDDQAPSTPTGPPSTTSYPSQSRSHHPSSPTRIRSPTPRSPPPKITTHTGYPTPPPSTSPSPTLTENAPSQIFFSAGGFSASPPRPAPGSSYTGTNDSPFSGLHAPIRFKRTPTNVSTSPIASSNLSSSPRMRRGSCSTGSKPHSSPVMGVRA